MLTPHQQALLRSPGIRVLIVSLVPAALAAGYWAIDRILSPLGRKV